MGAGELFRIVLVVAALVANIVLWFSLARRTDVPLSRSLAGKPDWSDRKHMMFSREASIFFYIPVSMIAIGVLTFERWGT